MAAHHPQGSTSEDTGMYAVDMEAWKVGVSGQGIGVMQGFSIFFPGDPNVSMKIIRDPKQKKI